MRRPVLPAVLTVLFVLCGQSGAALSASLADDRAVIAVVLEDFAHWSDATFGELEGVLELDPLSEANPGTTAEGVRALASEISDQLSDDLVSAFIKRNKSSAPVMPLVSESPWARLRQSHSDDAYPWHLSEGVKATGVLTFPGFSEDGSRALVQIQHSWSIHAAVVTYILSNEDGHWKVVARDQVVFL